MVAACHNRSSEASELNEDQLLTNFLLAAGIVILIVALRRTRQRKRPYRGLFTTVDAAIGRETRKVFDALDASVGGARLRVHWLLAEASDEHTGLLCGIAARPGPARLRIKKAIHERVKKADIRLEDTMRARLKERPCRMAVKRASDGKIVLLDRGDSVRYEKLSSPPEHDYTGYYTDRVEKHLTDREPDDLWQTAYDGTVTAKNSPGDDDTWVVIHTVGFDTPGLKRFRKAFENVHRLTFGGNPAPPHSDDRKTPVEVSVAEVELAHEIMTDYVLRLALRKSRRLNVLLWHMKRFREATLRAFPAYADALETAATESGALTAKAVGELLHNLPNRVVNAMAECMTDMERNFAARGVYACIEARIEKPHNIASEFDWSFQNRWESNGREPRYPALAYARTLGSRSFRRKMEVILGQDITMDVISAYDDAISARRLRARVAAACREHGAALPESAEEMAAVVENHPYFRSPFPPQVAKYRKMDKHEMFRQAVDDAVASVLCQEVEPQTEEDASTSG